MGNEKKDVFSDFVDSCIEFLHKGFELMVYLPYVLIDWIKENKQIVIEEINKKIKSYEELKKTIEDL